MSTFDIWKYLVLAPLQLSTQVPGEIPGVENFYWPKFLEQYLFRKSKKENYDLLATVWEGASMYNKWKKLNLIFHWRKSTTKAYKMLWKIHLGKIHFDKYASENIKIWKLLVIVFRKYMTFHSLPTLRVGPETPSEGGNLKVSVRKRKGLFGHKPRKNCQNEKQEMKLETNQEMLLLLLSKKTSNCENRFLQIGLVGSITLLAPGERIAHFNAMDFSPIFNYGAPKILPIFDHHLNLIHLQYLKRGLLHIW